MTIALFILHSFHLYCVLLTILFSDLQFIALLINYDSFCFLVLSHYAEAILILGIYLRVVFSFNNSSGVDSWNPVTKVKLEGVLYLKKYVATVSWLPILHVIW